MSYNECRHCGEEIHLDRSDTGPGGWLANGGIRGRTLLCDGFDDQREHEPAPPGITVGRLSLDELADLSSMIREINDWAEERAGVDQRMDRGENVGDEMFDNDDWGIDLLRTSHEWLKKLRIVAAKEGQQ